MSLTIRQRIFALTDTYDICDHTGAVRYYVSAEFFTIGHKIHVFDANMQEIGKIEERIFQFLPKARLIMRGIPVGEISREFTFFKPRYSIDFNGWQVSGDIFGWDYSIVDARGDTVATISKELFRFSDTYTLSLADASNPNNELAALLVAISIDMFNCQK